MIYPCKACVSTAMPLCHWPCSCYPNHAMGQTQDWMNEIYPRWVARARRDDRDAGQLVPGAVGAQADDRSPGVRRRRQPRSDDRRGGKDPARAKALELAGWDYPKHLAGRAFAVVVHGDAAGVEELRRILCDWLTDMELIQAGPSAALGRYLGYYQPVRDEPRRPRRGPRAAGRGRERRSPSLVETVRQIRSGRYRAPDAGLEAPRQK